MDYYRQSQPLSHAGQTAPQSYVYQQAASAASNSGVYAYQPMGYAQHASPYGMQPSVSQGSAMVNQQNIGGTSANRRSRPSDGNASMHRTGNQDEPPIRMVVDARFVGAIIGHQGNKIKEISRESSARCIVEAQKGVRDSQGQTEKCIMIHGTPSNATTAVVKILEVVEAERERDRDRDKESGGAGDGHVEEKHEVELKLRAHNRLVGRLIGKQGMTIKKIMSDTNTVIFVSNDATGSHSLAGMLPQMYADVLLPSERTITVRAPTIAAVSTAEQRISAKLRQSYESDLSSQMPYAASTAAQIPMMAPMAYDASALAGGMRMAPASSFKCAKMFVPNAMVGAIIGSKGSHIRNIMRTTGAHVRIEGSGDKKEEKKEKGTETDDTQKHDEEDVKTDKSDEEPKKDDVGEIEGDKRDKGGSTIDDERLITITGQDQQIYRAIYAIFAKVAEQQGMMNPFEVKLRTEVQVPSKLVGRIIGKGGQNVRELQRITQAHVKIAEEGLEGGEGTIENKTEEKKEGEELCDTTTVRVTGHMQATIAVLVRICTLITDFSRNDRPNGSSSVTLPPATSPLAE